MKDCCEREIECLKQQTEGHERGNREGNGRGEQHLEEHREGDREGNGLGGGHKEHELGKQHREEHKVVTRAVLGEATVGLHCKYPKFSETICSQSEWTSEME